MAQIVELEIEDQRLERRMEGLERRGRAGGGGEDKEGGGEGGGEEGEEDDGGGAVRGSGCFLACLLSRCRFEYALVMIYTCW